MKKGEHNYYLRFKSVMHNMKIFLVNYKSIIMKMGRFILMEVLRIQLMQNKMNKKNKKIQESN